MRFGDNVHGWLGTWARRGIPVWLPGLVLFLSGAVRAEVAAQGELHVAVSIVPQAYIVERVGGAHVEVQVLVGAGQSPHAYELTAKQMVRLSEAKAYFRIGVEFENALLPRIERAHPDLKVVDLREGIPLRQMEGSCDDYHAEGGEPHAGTEDIHGQGRPDPHIWLSPRLAKTMAQTVCNTLCRLDPDRAADYRRNLGAFQGELDRVHDEIAAMLAPLKGQRVLVFHPAFGYFMDEFGLEQRPVEVEGKQPTARQLVRLIDTAKEENVKVIFVQPQFSKKSATVVADAIGGVVVPMDPLAADYLENLRDMARAVEAGLRKK